jgi:hypothetical protein
MSKMVQTFNNNNNISIGVYKGAGSIAHVPIASTITQVQHKYTTQLHKHNKITQAQHKYTAQLHKHNTSTQVHKNEKKEHNRHMTKAANLTTIT